MPSMRRLRRRSGATGQKMRPYSIVLICLAAAILLTLTVGNLLRLWLDDETYRKMIEGVEPLPGETQAPEVNGVAINAPLWRIGDRIAPLEGSNAVSIPLNTADGTMRYTSDVVRYFGLSAEQGAPALGSEMQELLLSIPYASGVFYSSALSYELADLRYAATVREAAILREFYHAGASELVIRGLPLETATVDEVRAYASAIRVDAQNFRLGIAVPISVAESDAGWRILSQLQGIADFFVLDVTAEPLEDDADEYGNSASAAELLGRSNYFLSQYQMRLMAADTQTLLVDMIEARRYSNYQIVE